jgi:hypothetical protein
LINLLSENGVLPPDVNLEMLRSPAQVKLNGNQSHEDFMKTLILCEGDVMLHACEDMMKMMWRDHEVLEWTEEKVNLAKQRIANELDPYYRGGTVAYTIPLHSTEEPRKYEHWVEGGVVQPLFRDAYAFAYGTRVRRASSGRSLSM